MRPLYEYGLVWVAEMERRGDLCRGHLTRRTKSQWAKGAPTLWGWAGWALRPKLGLRRCLHVGAAWHRGQAEEGSGSQRKNQVHNVLGISHYRRLESKPTMHYWTGSAATVSFWLWHVCDSCSVQCAWVISLPSKSHELYMQTITNPAETVASKYQLSLERNQSSLTECQI